MGTAAQGIAICGLWFFLVWLGWSALDHHTADGDFLLGAYVFLGSTGLSIFLWKLIDR